MSDKKLIQGFHETKIKSETDANKSYTVTYNELSKEKTPWSCTCGDFVFRQKDKGGYCKHIVSVLDESRVIRERSLTGDPEIVYTGDPEILKSLRSFLDNNAVDDEFKNNLKHVLDHTKTFVSLPLKTSKPDLIANINESKDISGPESVTDKTILHYLNNGVPEFKSVGVLEPVDYINYFLYINATEAKDREVAIFMHNSLIDKGYNPRGVFKLSTDNFVRGERCNNCGFEWMVLVDDSEYVDEGYLCGNEQCMNSVNHVTSIARIKNIVTNVKWS